jgi:hypothetical protein
MPDQISYCRPDSDAQKLLSLNFGEGLLAALISGALQLAMYLLWLYNNPLKINGYCFFRIIQKMYSTFFNFYSWIRTTSPFIHKTGAVECRELGAIELGLAQLILLRARW